MVFFTSEPHPEGEKELIECQSFGLTKAQGRIIYLKYHANANEKGDLSRVLNVSQTAKP